MSLVLPNISRTVTPESESWQPDPGVTSKLMLIIGKKCLSLRYPAFCSIFENFPVEISSPFYHEF